MPRRTHQNKHLTTSKKYKHCNWQLTDQERDSIFELNYYDGIEKQWREIYDYIETLACTKKESHKRFLNEYRVKNILRPKIKTIELAIRQLNKAIIDKNKQLQNNEIKEQQEQPQQ